MYVQWDPVDLFSPSAPEIKENRKADRHLDQVHQINSRAFSLKRCWDSVCLYVNLQVWSLKCYFFSMWINHVSRWWKLMQHKFTFDDVLWWKWLKNGSCTTRQKLNHTTATREMFHQLLVRLSLCDNGDGKTWYFLSLVQTADKKACQSSLNFHSFSPLVATTRRKGKYKRLLTSLLR